MIIDIVINGFLILLGTIMLLATIWLFNKKRIWFVTLNQNRIKLISVNGKYEDYIHNTPGFVKNIDTGELVKDDENILASEREEPLSGWKKWVFDKVNLYFIGLSPFRRVMTFDVTLERVADDAATKSKLIEKFVQGGVRTEDELRHMFTRPFLLINAETQAQFSINMLFMGKLYVHDPKKFVIDTDFKPFPLLQAAFNDHVTTIISVLTWDRIRQDSAKSLFFPANNAVPKQEPGQPVQERRDRRTLNEKLLDSLGVTCDELSKEDPEISERDVPIYEALKEKEKQKLLGQSRETTAQYDKKVTVLGAEAKKESRVLEAQGESTYITQVALANANGFGSLVEEYVRRGATPADVNERIITETKYSKLVGLRTLVDGTRRLPVGININDEVPNEPIPVPVPQETKVAEQPAGQQNAPEQPRPKRPNIKKRRK